MAVTERTVKNKRNSAGELTGKAGTVYDVNVKYKSGGKSKTYSRKGFLTKKDALQHEAEMKAKLTNPAYTPPSAVQRKMTVREYMTEWIDRHGSANLRPSTEASYRSHMKNHIFPYIGDVFLNQLSPAMLDDMYRQLAEKGLSQSSVKYAHRIMGVSLEHARRYHYISSNPARDILTKFGKQGKTPDPYTVDQMRQLLAVVMGTEWELIVVLGGLYGLRLSEIIGLRWRNVDLDENTFGVVEQLPFNTPANTTVISEMAPVKSSERTLPITPLVRPYFERHLEVQKEQKRFAKQSGNPYFDNDLVFAKPNGAPKRREFWTVAASRRDAPYPLSRSVAHSSHQYAPVDRRLLHSRTDPGAQPEGDRHSAPALQQPGSRHGAVCGCADGAQAGRPEHLP